MISRKDEIKNTIKEIKTFLSTDPIYQPIIKKLGVFSREVLSFDQYVIEQYDKEQLSFKALLEKADRQYLNFVESTKTNLEVTKTEQQNEIEFNLINYREALKKLLVKHREALRLIDDKAESANFAQEEAIKQVELQMMRKFALIDKENDKIKNIYQKQILEIENDKDTSLKLLNENYDQSRQQLENINKTSNQTNHKTIADIQIRHDQSIKSNDENYLLIKQNFNEISIQLNKKINEHKKTHQKAYQQIEKQTEKLIKPIIEKINLQTQAYEQAKVDAKDDYQIKLTQLNSTFDEQKVQYELKKDKIIHRTNENITLLNSKLSAFREASHKDKLETAKIYQTKIAESLVESDKDQLSKARTKKYKQYDFELNKQIIRAQKTILQKQKEHQRLITSNDQNHLEEVNAWRLKKSLIEYEQKQTLIKLDLNYNYNHTVLDMQKKLIEADDQFFKESIQIDLNKDLISLEAQLQIASSIQERDLNMLANDAHFDIASHKQALYENEYLLDSQNAKFKHDLQKLNALYEADQHVLNVTTQLNLEKEKSKRDSNLNEQHLKHDLEKALFERKMTVIQYDLSQETALLEMDRELINHIHHFEHESLKMAMQKETRMRQYEIRRSQLNAEKVLSNEKSLRLLKLDQLELEYSQLQNTRFMSILHFDHHFRLRLQDLLIETYVLPAHPETFKQFLQSLIFLVEIFEKHQIKQLEFAHDEDAKLYVKKINDFTNYKYTLKHEDTIHYFDQQVKKTSENKTKLIQTTKRLEQEIIIKQQALEHHHSEIQKLLSTHHKEDVSSFKENQKLKLNHEQETKKLTFEVSHIDKEINNIHRKILPLNEQLEKLELERQKALNKLEIDKQAETALLQRYLSKNQTIYQHIAKIIKTQTNTVVSIFNRLIAEMYVTDMTLEQLMNTLYLDEANFGVNLVKFQQKFLTLMFAFYKESELEHQSILKRFERSNENLLKILDENNQLTKKQETNNDQKRLSDKQKGIFEIKNQLKKRLDLLNLTHEKDISQVQNKIQTLENEIQVNYAKQQNELQSLSSNQTAIASQFAQDYEKQMKEMALIFKKESQLKTRKYQDSNIQHEALRQSIESKNNVLYQRYQNQRDKIISSLNQRLNSQINHANKIKLSNIAKHKHFESAQKRLKQRLEHEQLHMSKHYKRYLRETSKAQNLMLNKEIGMLKKSHRFKIKMLRLN